MHLPGQNKATPFIIFIFFLVTFILARLMVNFFPNTFLNFRGVHVHHYAYGIVIISLTGLYDLIADPSERMIHVLAAIFGIGLALAYDEFGMWLRLIDFYPSRSSYDAIIVITLILLSLIYFPGFWNRFGKKF